MCVVVEKPIGYPNHPKEFGYRMSFLDYFKLDP